MLNKHSFPGTHIANGFRCGDASIGSREFRGELGLVFGVSVFAARVPRRQMSEIKGFRNDHQRNCHAFKSI